MTEKPYHSPLPASGADALIEDLLREADGLLLGLLRNELVGVYLVQDDYFRYVNARLAELFGYSPEELCNRMGPMELTAPEYRSMARDAMEKRLRNEVSNAGYFFDGLRKDGNRIRAEVFSASVTFGGRPAIIGMLIDETERHRAELDAQEQLHFVMQLIEAVPNPMFYKDEQGRYLGCNRAFEQFIGKSRREIVGKTVHELSPAELADRYLVADQALFDSRGVQIYESAVRSASGDYRDVVFYKATFDKMSGSLGGLVGVILDITERKRMEQALALRAQEWRTLVENSPDTIARYDRNCRRIYVNPAFCALAEGGEATLLGKRPAEYPGGEDSLGFETKIREVFASGKNAETEMIWNERQGREVCSHIRLTPEFDASGAVVTVIAVGHDISELNLQRREIHQMAFYDSLTRLPNRRLLLDRLRQALVASARSGLIGALLFIDLDNFKALNDTLGHVMGDLLLQQVSERLVFCVRECDSVARLGGDEFVVMLEGLSEQPLDAAAQTESIGEKILAALNRPYLLDTYEYSSGSSIGVTLFDRHHPGVDELFKQADIAMYQAKKSGRNTMRFFDPQMQDAISARVTLEGEIRKALEWRQFCLHYQIQVDGEGCPLGAEALLRWQHPERGLVPPVQFIPLAEEAGLILPIGEWVLETACAQLKRWQDGAATRNLALAINVSARQFHQPGFADQVRDALRRHVVDPALLKLELTESLLLEDIEDTVAKMNLLNEIGVRFSLDDFGTGYSSLQYLKRLPLDQIKIDQSFVRNIAVDGNDRGIVHTIIAMARSLNLGIIAEGVETEEQRQILADSGCLHYQGYLFGRPVPIEQFEAQLRLI